MGKQQIQGLVSVQYDVLNSQDNKERIRFVVAGCREGRLYNMSGTDFGMFNEEAPDTEFITDADLDLSRITGARLSSITKKMKDFFNKYGVSDVTDSSNDDNDTNDSDSDDTNSSNDDVESKKDKKNKVSNDKKKELKVNIDEVVAKCKKAIKKEKFDKARELIKLLGDIDIAKKLSKKLKKAEK